VTKKLLLVSSRMTMIVTHAPQRQEISMQFPGTFSRTRHSSRPPAGYSSPEHPRPGRREGRFRNLLRKFSESGLDRLLATPLSRCPPSPSTPTSVNPQQRRTCLNPLHRTQAHGTSHAGSRPPDSNAPCRQRGIPFQI